MTRRAERHRLLRDLVSRQPIASQQELVDALVERGFEVTQATVSRDIAEVGLVKIVRGGRHVYALADGLTARANDDEPLRRVLSDLPVTVRRSGLILLLVSTPGSAGAIAEAIDRSTLNEQEGTVAGDNTVLVLFRDDSQLERWRNKIERLQPAAGVGRATEP